MKKAHAFHKKNNNHIPDFIKRIKIHHFIWFPIVFVYYEILMRLFNDTPVFSHLAYPVIFAVAAGLVCAAVTSLFKGKVNRIITIVVMAVVAFFYGFMCVIKNTYQVYMTLSSIISGAGNVAGDYGSDVKNGFIGAIPVIILYYLPLVIYLLLGKKRIQARRYRPMFALILVAVAVALGGIGSAFAYHMPAVSEKYTTQYEYDSAIRTFGLLTGTRLDARRSLFGDTASETLQAEQLVTEPALETVEEEETPASTTIDDSAIAEFGEVVGTEFDTEVSYGDNVMDIDFDSLVGDDASDDILQMNSYVESLTPSSKNEYTGLFEGKNLIIIAAEAFSSQVVNEELTPTLYRLVHKGIYFSDFYQPAWGGSTSTGEFSITIGLVPTNGVNSILDTEGKNLYFTMGNQLQRAGYSSVAYHNGDYDYYSRNLTHTNLGYDTFLAWGNGLEDLLPKWSGDKETFEATLPTYMDDQPFSVYYMTLSGHCTYDADDEKVAANMDRVKEVLGDTYCDKVLYYFCYQLELEKALESMVDMLEDAGIADDTVIVLCADHYPYGLAKSSTFGNTQDYLTDLYKDDNYDKFTRDSSDLIIWSGCIEDMGLEVDTPTMSLDILPTLSNLFGLEYDSRLLVGRDVFSDATPLVLWTDHSFVTDKGTYDANTGEFTPNPGETVDDDYVEAMKTIVSNKISFSKKVINYDYYGLLFGEDPETGPSSGN